MDEKDKEILGHIKQKKSIAKIAEILNLTENEIYSKISMPRGEGYVSGALDNLQITRKGKDVLKERIPAQKSLQPSEEIKYACFGVRFIGTLIDGVAYTVLLVILIIPVFILKSPILIIPLMILFLFLPIYEVGKMGGRVGHRLLKLRVVSGNMNEPIGLRKAFVGEVIGNILCVFTLYIGYLLIIFDPKKQGLHDKVANTYVIHEKSI